MIFPDRSIRALTCGNVPDLTGDQLNNVVTKPPEIGPKTGSDLRKQVGFDTTLNDA